MVKRFFLDTETTGVEIQESYIIEIGGVIEYKDVYEEFVLYSRPIEPDYVLSEEAMEKHGFTREDIDSYPSCQEAYSSLLSILEKHIDKYNKTDKLFCYGYGAEFDMKHLRKFFEENDDKYFGAWFWHPWVDVMSLVMHSLVEERHRLENFKLATVAKYLGIAVDEEMLHRTMYDNYLCREVFTRVAKNEVIKRTVEDVKRERMRRALRRHQSTIVDDIPF